MRIGFIAEPHEEKNASGMGYAVRELMRHLLEEGSTHEYVFYSSAPITPAFVRGKFENVIIPKGFVKQFFWFLFFRATVDVLVFMVPLLPLWIFGRVKTVPICQELGSQKIKPEGFKASLEAFVRDRVLMPITLRLATHIVVPSEATRTDVMKYYGVAKNRLSLIYNGFQSLETVRNEPPAVSLTPYFFFAGRVKYRKNVHGIVSAFIRFKERTGAPVKLLIAGGYGGHYFEAMRTELAEHRLEQEVKFLGYVSTEELRGLFSGATAYIYPSFNEGFGMPILEAMSLGTPVITSNISSMSEVAGDAALLVDPADPNDISRAMEKVYTDLALRAKLVAKGYQRAKLFSWAKAGQEYITLLGRIVYE